MDDGSFELDGVLAFGERGEIIVEKFTPGAAADRSQTFLNPRGDNAWFGRDRKTPGTWTWSLSINRTNEAEALETLARIEEAWDNEDIRLTPGAQSILRYRVAGRVRRIYGRARRCEPVIDVRRLVGVIPVEVDFERVDTLHYDDVEQSVTLTTVPVEAGGLTEEGLVDPLTSLDSPSVTRAGQITVAGPSATWAVVTFEGATGASDLRIVVDEEWAVGIDGPVSYDERIVVDARPWIRAATVEGGGSASGRLAPATRMELMRLTPGQHEIRFEGSDPTGTASATVAWRPASKSL